MKTFIAILSLVLIFAVLSIILWPQIYQFFADDKWPEKLSALSTFAAAAGGLTLLFYTYKNFREIKKQNEPVITVKITPDKDILTFYNVWIKNFGNSAAYDIETKFEPDLLYREDLTLNNLRVFQHLNVLEKGEEIKFFLFSGPEYLNNENNIFETTINISYYSSPSRYHIFDKKYIKKYKIDLKENYNQLNPWKSTMTDLVKEVKELKQGILMLLADYREEKRK